jgi:2-C-methyl-D-erythritol 4-phosphate cytidylyltransferase
MIDVIYLSAGKGNRAKLGYPKQYARLGGKPIMIHGLEILQRMDIINKIIITVSESEMVKTTELVMQYGIDKATIIFGGNTRQESTKYALDWITTEDVLIMEAVRPFITADFILKIIEMNNDFITPIRKSISTVITFDGNWLDRRFVGEVQMPQKYKTELLCQAHTQATHLNYTDDAALIIDTLRLIPTIIDGLEENIKITTPLDLQIAEAIYANNYNRE